MSVRFLHTADWQMGMKALQAGDKAKDVRSKRYETAAKVVELAKQEEVDFVLIAGDLFEHHDVDESVVRKTVAILDGFAPMCVFVLPGNHDPLVAGGVWDRQSWLRIGNHVTLLRDSEEVQVSEHVAIFPCSLHQKQSTMDPTRWIPDRTAVDERIRIGIAHGSLDVLPERTNFPIAARRTEEAGLDYLALGDWHGFLRSGRAIYAGTMEQTGFAEKDPGNVVVAEIAHAGAEIVLVKHRTGQLNWSDHRPEIQDETDVETLRALLSEAGSLSSQLLRIAPRITAGITPAAAAALRALRAELLEDAFFTDWPEDTLAGAMDADVVLPNGLLFDVDSDLSAILDRRIPEGPGREGASEDLSVVEEARALLRKLAMEATR